MADKKQPNDPYAALVQTGTVGGHAPNESPVGVAQGVSTPDDPYAALANQPAAAPPQESYSTQLLKSIPGAAKSIGKGLLEGAGSDVANLTGNAKLKALTTPSGDENDIAGQKFGKGVEQAGEFLIPGLGEEKAMSLVPDLKYAKPLAKVGYNALTSGALNKAQGGDFGTGALVGGIGSGAGQVLNEMAPAVAEKALGIRGKFDRSFNKTPGLAALEETKGIRPETVAASAKERIGELGSQVNDLADKASVVPEVNYVKRGGDIDYPATEAGLPPVKQGNTRLYRSESPTTGFKDIFDAEGLKNFGENRPPGKAYTPDLKYADYYRDAYGPDAKTTYRDIPEREAQAAKFGDSEHILPESNPSLVPARNIVSNAMGSAERQNAAGTHGQLQNMQDFLSRRFSTGEAIPENVTPRDLLDLRRGFNEEHGRWNPDLHDTTVSTGRQAYGGLTGEFHRVLPEAEPLDTRISNLIPVKNRASIAALGDNTLQKTLGRVAAHTGGGLGGYYGGVEGYKHGGIGGAIAGAALGVAAPEFLSSPEGQMLLARRMYGARALGPLQGAILNLPSQGNPDEK